MKKILIGLLALLMVIFCAGCGQYSQPVTPPDGDTSIVDPPHGDDQEEEKFTVELTSGGNKYVPPYIPGKNVSARWTAIDGGSIHEAIFNDDGIAEIGGLDGDYKVTLVGLPDNVTYNPQGYSADNDNKHIVIEILRISRITHSTGSGLLGGSCTPISVSTSSPSGSTYRAIIDSPWNGAKDQYSSRFEGIVFYEFTPVQEGWYSVESLVDITSNEVSPILEWYRANSQSKFWYTTITDGGAASTFTKNFKFEIRLTQEYIGNAWAFGIHADSKDGTYPIKIDFTIKYEGEYAAEPEPDYTEILPKGPYADPDAVVSGTFRYNYRDTNFVLRGSRFKLNKADGFYHLYDEVRYADNNGYGPLLYAKITQANEVVDIPFISKRDDDDSLAGISLKFECRNPFDYNEIFYKDYGKLIGKYSVYCNSDGVHPVNEDLQKFLQDWAVKETYFHDGNGWAETGNMKLASSFEDQWLFCCGYYI